MTLHIYSDASYGSEPKSRSRVGGHYTLTNKSHNPTQPPVGEPIPNGAIHTVSNIMRNVMSSATEAECGGLFHNTKDGAMLRTTLEEMGHPQPPTPIQTDNSNATGISNSTVKQRKSKAMDMRFYWVQDRVRQGQFLVYWRPGTENLADYFTKHFPASHHQKMRPTYLHIAATAIAPCPARVCSFPSGSSATRADVLPKPASICPSNGPVLRTIPAMRSSSKFPVHYTHYII